MSEGHSIGACIRVSYEDKFLLIKRSTTDFSPGIYEMPGGAVDTGEKIEVAASRELFEETGIEVPPHTLSPLGVFEFHNIETGKHKTKFAFSVTLTELPTITLSTDHGSSVFMNKEDIEKLPRQGRDNEYLIWQDHYTVLMN